MAEATDAAQAGRQGNVGTGRSAEPIIVSGRAAIALLRDIAAQGVGPPAVAD
jgi:hypothetical protein